MKWLWKLQFFSASEGPPHPPQTLPVPTGADIISPYFGRPLFLKILDPPLIFVGILGPLFSGTQSMVSISTVNLLACHQRLTIMLSPKDPIFFWKFWSIMTNLSLTGPPWLCTIPPPPYRHKCYLIVGSNLGSFEGFKSTSQNNHFQNFQFTPFLTEQVQSIQLPSFVLFCF